MIWFTSDTHFNHRSVIDFCKRPFSSVDEMNECMIERWNERVAPNDTVWHLGDFSLGSTENAEKVLSRLQGEEIHLVVGNHDSRQVKKFSRWASVSERAEVKIGDEHIVLSHYSHRVWNRSHYGAYMLYGHSHGDLYPICRSLDVGVDSWDFYPVSFDEIKAKLESLGLLHCYTKNHRIRE